MAPKVRRRTSARAEGVRVWDTDGKEYLDFIGGLGVMNVGHGHPRVVKAVQAQLERLTHTCFQVAMYEPYVQLAERLNALVGGPSNKTLLLTTGAEAIENAIKIARGYTNRPAVVAFTGGFHGRTLLGMTLTASGHTYRQNFGPFAPEVYHAPFPYEYRGWSAEKALEALHQLFETGVAADRVAAVIIEPQLGEGFLKLAQRFPQIGDVRGLGAMLALEFVKDRESKEPAADFALGVVERSRERGLLLLRCGPYKNVIRVLVPLVASADDIECGSTILEAALEETSE